MLTFILGFRYEEFKTYITVDCVIASVDLIPETGQIRVIGHHGESYQEVEEQRHRMSMFCDSETFEEYYDLRHFVCDLKEVGILP